MRTRPLFTRNTAAPSAEAPAQILDIGITEEQMLAAERTEIGGGLVQFSARCAVPFLLPLTSIRRKQAAAPPAPPAATRSLEEIKAEESTAREAHTRAEANPDGMSAEDLASLKSTLDRLSRERAEREALASAEAARMEDDESGAGEEKAERSRVISGIASSTSVDSYGTEMSRGCLEMMADQFKAGVAYLPRHGTWSRPVEWDEQIGLTIDAEVIRASVEEPHPDAEEQHLLRVFTDIWDGRAEDGSLTEAGKIADALLLRIDQERAPGQSIGGWFTRVVWVWNDETDELERIIVEEVRLDHLAVTRRPANPDSEGMERLRSMIRTAHAPPQKPEDVDAESRSDEPEQPAGAEASTPTTDEPARIRSAEAADKPPSTPLDTPLSASHSNLDPEIEDRGATSSAPGESEMTPEEIAALVAQTMRAELAPLTSRLETLEGTRAAAPAAAPAVDPVAPAAAPADVSARMAELEAENALLSGRMAQILEQPQRRGIIGVAMLPEGGEAAQGEMRAVLDLACEGAGKSGLPAVRSFFGDNGKGMRAFEEGVDPSDPMARDQGTEILTVRGLKRLLRSGLRAFALDGLLGNDALSASWTR